MSDVTRYATIVLAGRPNAGKSSLLNALVESRLAIVSPRPQTTRHTVAGVHTDANVQLEFIDPPGLLEPAYLLQTAMLTEAVEAMKRADGVVVLHATDQPEESLEAMLPDAVGVEVPTLNVATKVDLLDEGDRSRVAWVDLMVSSVTGEGIDDLIAWCQDQARPGPFRHDPDAISDRPVRFFVSEFIREAAFAALEQELPYSVAVEIDEFRDGSMPLYIRAAILVERESQKGIVIGKAGRTVKMIGTAAREATEALLGEQVYLDLRVRVLPKWRRSPHHLKRLGFHVPTKEA